MPMVEIELPDWLYRELVSFAVSNGREVDEVIEEAVNQYINDHEESE